jgi:CIC family chloride channel protein
VTKNLEARAYLHFEWNSFGYFEATAAHYFRAGIHFIEQFVSNRFDNANRFVLFFCSLSTAAFVISLIKANFCVIGWHGPADTIFAAHRVENKFGIASTLAAFFSAAGGASVGQYGPLAHFGATLGSCIKAILKLRISTDIVLGGGVAAAISAGFSTPLTGMIFAHEGILRHF